MLNRLSMYLNFPYTDNWLFLSSPYMKRYNHKSMRLNRYMSCYHLIHMYFGTHNKYFHIQ